MIYKLVTRVIEYFCFAERPMKGGDILDFQKGEGNLKKRWGVDLEKGGYDPPYQLCSWTPPKVLGPPPPNLMFCSGAPLKLGGGGGATMAVVQILMDHKFQ